MSINWNYYLSCYQQARGGHFFGALEEDCDCHLVLTGEETPLLVWIDTDPADGSCERNILARAMVKLDGEYDLHIQPRTLVGGRLMNVASLVTGGLEFGQSEATRGRAILSTNKYLLRQVLEESGVQEGLTTWKKVYLRIRPAPRGEGWHVVEIADINFEGHPVTGSHWICDAMDRETAHLSRTERDELLREGRDHFNVQMDAFLNFLRAACRAATTWKP